ncbi:MAG: phospholipase [Acidobacteriia bacterium]|nr:phospholipase [Terriglobia bacterium]
MPITPPSRRRFICAIPAATGLALSGRLSTLRAQSLTEKSRLSARPSKATGSVPAGLHPLGLRAERDALLYVPESAAKYKRVPLIISLHGAGRTADRAIELLRSLSDEHGFLLLAPASEAETWDVIRSTYGPDIAFLNQSLARTFELRNVDPRRVAIAGFSDGASYSLSVGLTNGDFFRAVFGFSPGFIIPGEFTGRPDIFISHGTIDPILPIDECSRRIVPALKRSGYRVTYREFEGKHTLPPEIASEAMRWFMHLA